MDYDKLAASSPINRSAASVTGKGEAFTPRITLQDCYDDRPPIRNITQHCYGGGGEKFKDFTGRTFGRLTVLGLVDKSKWHGIASSAKASWACRCACGKYCTRTTKSLFVAERGGNTFRDRCGSCDYTRRLSEGRAPRLNNINLGAFRAR